MLSMNKVSYFYDKKTKRNILEQFTASFEEGKFYVLYGESGSGKTTCLSLLGGLDEPKSGEILLDGKDIKNIGYNNLRRHHVAYVFQDFHLFSYMTAVENVMIAINGKMNKTKKREKAISLLEMLDITDVDYNRVVSKLSGGQQQRVAIARALVTDAKYILADEPTGNLDKENSVNIISIFKRLVKEQNKCVIVVTHSDYVKKQSDVAISLEKWNEE